MSGGGGRAASARLSKQDGCGYVKSDEETLLEMRIYRKKIFLKYIFSWEGFGQWINTSYS